MTARTCALSYGRHIGNGDRMAREAEQLAGVALVSQRRFEEAWPPLQASERTFLALPGWGSKDAETVSGA